MWFVSEGLKKYCSFLPANIHCSWSSIRNCWPWKICSWSPTIVLKVFWLKSCRMFTAWKKTNLNKNKAKKSAAEQRAGRQDSEDMKTNGGHGNSPLNCDDRLNLWYQRVECQAVYWRKCFIQSERRSTWQIKVSFPPNVLTTFPNQSKRSVSVSLSSFIKSNKIVQLSVFRFIYI